MCPWRSRRSPEGSGKHRRTAPLLIERENMLTVEEYVQRIVESNRGNEEAMVSMIAHEIHLLHAALPTPAYLESVADQLEVVCVQEMDLPDGETFNGPEFLRHAAQVVRLIMYGEMDLQK
jgi:hypothetical protein